MKDLIKRYWDIFGGAFCGLGLSYMVHWELNNIQLIYSIIILILVCIGLFKVLKTSVDKQLQRKQMVLDKLIDNQKPMRAISIANNPTKTGEDLAEVLIDTMKGGKKLMEKIKNLFAWIGHYWQQLLGLFSALITYGIYIYALLEEKFSFILNVLPQTAQFQLWGKIGLIVIATIILILTLRNEFKWVGLGSIETAKNYIEQKTEQINSQLSGDAKANVKKAVKQFESEYKKVVKEISNYESQIKSIESQIKSVSELLKIGLGDQAQYNQLNLDKQKLVSNLSEAKVKENELQANILKYKQVL